MCLVLLSMEDLLNCVSGIQYYAPFIMRTSFQFDDNVKRWRTSSFCLCLLNGPSLLFGLYFGLHIAKSDSLDATNQSSKPQSFAAI